MFLILGDRHKVLYSCLRSAVKKKCGIGMKANVGDASADAGVSTHGVHAEAKLGK